MDSSDQHNQLNNERRSQIVKRILSIVIVLILFIAIPIIFYHQQSISQWFNSMNKTSSIDSSAAVTQKLNDNDKKNNFWISPTIASVKDSATKKMIEFGKDLIAHTSIYYGPKGSIKKISNGMNCQNCHLNAGTVIYGNNYSAVASNYPKFRARSGSIESIEKRVNDCFERSLNGHTIDSVGKEMNAIVAYIKFVGSNISKNQQPAGAGLKKINFLSRAANPLAGKNIYSIQCQKCHQPNGEGVLNELLTEYIYPPLWGTKSFNDGAGLYRISNFASYVKYNMPQGVTHDSPQLTDEEAWDVSAYILSQKRTHLNKPKDWPDISRKPIDHPFKPYVDNFSEEQHKLGPFLPIIAANKK